MFRRMIALLLSALVLLSLSGCSGIDLSALLSAAESAQQTSQASGPASSAKPSGTPEEVFVHSAELRSIGLDVPECARLAGALRAKGFDIPERVYRMEDVEAAILRELGRGGGETC